MQLLISVLGPHEVAAALEGGADIVDLKDPASGPLGAPTPDVLRAVRAVVPASLPLSVALGDAAHQPGTFALAARAAALLGADFVKVGLLGSAHPALARRLLGALRRALDESGCPTRLVAVAYADAARVGGLAPAELPAVARDAGAAGMMLDTVVKDGTSAVAVLGEAEVARILHRARELGLTAGLAGSLGPAELARAARLGAEVVGIRGAACTGGRTGVLSARRVRALRAALGLSVPASPPSGAAPAPPADAPGAGR